MKLATISFPPYGRTGAILGDEVLDFASAVSFYPLASWVPASLTAAIGGGSEGMEILRRLIKTIEDAPPAVREDLCAIGALKPLQSTRLDAPIPRPTILLSHARAYRDHLAEMGKNETIPDYPIGFMKNGRSVIGPNAPIVLPPSAADMVDFEGEISVVFGRPCYGVTAGEALSHVLGVTIVNDVSARDWVPEIKTFPDRNRMGKQFPSFAPMDPWISTLDEFEDVNDLHLVTRLNDEVMQDARTSELIWGLPELIAYYARWYPFAPGDVLTTGSPAGVGYGRTPKRFLKPGDRLSITVDSLGTLSNPICSTRRETVLLSEGARP